MSSVTVVTVVRNDRAHVEDTVRSVRAQGFSPLQYVVIDGASDDGTLELLRDHASGIDVLVSEPDRGIYDAMNKGIARADGEWIHFLNSGDTFCAPDTLQRVFARKIGADVLYGDHEADYGYMVRRHRAGPLSSLRTGMVFSHQAMLVRTERMKRRPFETEHDYAADYAFIYRLYREGVPFQYVPVPIARLRAGGHTEQAGVRTYVERWGIARSYEKGPGRVVLDLRHLALVAARSAVGLAKAVLPPSWTRRLTALRHGRAGPIAGAESRSAEDEP